MEPGQFEIVLKKLKEQCIALKKMEKKSLKFEI